MVLHIVSVVGWLDVHVNTHCGFSIMGELPGWVCELKFCTGGGGEPCPERWGGVQGVRPDLGGDQPGLLGG